MLKNRKPSLAAAGIAPVAPVAGGAKTSSEPMVGALVAAARQALAPAWPALSRRVGRLAAMLLLAGVAVGVGGCATSDYDPTANWTADQLYADAKGELDSGNWSAAVKALQKLESRYPFGRYAQQAQLDLAWASYKEGERAEALVAVYEHNGVAVYVHPEQEASGMAMISMGAADAARTRRHRMVLTGTGTPRRWPSRATALTRRGRPDSTLS